MKVHHAYFQGGARFGSMPTSVWSKLIHLALRSQGFEVGMSPDGVNPYASNLRGPSGESQAVSTDVQSRFRVALISTYVHRRLRALFHKVSQI